MEEQEKIKRLIDSFQIENIELAYAMWEWANFDVDEYIQDNYGVFFLDKAVKGETITQKMLSLSQLKKLWLSHNQLKSLPESIGNLSQLEWLYLEENPISKTEQEKIKKMLPNTEIYF